MTKGLDDFAKTFLLGTPSPNEGEQEYIQTTPGGKVDEKAMEAYLNLRKEEFIKKAGSFTEDLIAFFVEQRKLRNLSDKEAVFAMALATINLRHSYVHSKENYSELDEEFDAICWGAQQYFDANKDD